HALPIFHWKPVTSTTTSGSSSSASTDCSVTAVKKNSTQTMTTGSTTTNSSSGTLYWSCLGRASVVFFFFRWNAADQKMSPHTIAPTPSAAMTAQVQNVRIFSASTVALSGQPNRRISSPEQPVAVKATSAASAATLPALPSRVPRVRSGTPTP